ncbi:hypothetical protein EU245_07380 [Lentibacillus lipolyticus]|nr:hypothetical protein EU245_07380 [Lentibacillus lipolyticus]
MNIGIVDAGAIANFLMKEINQNGTGEMQIKSVFVRDPGNFQELERMYERSIHLPSGAIGGTG